jgi:hypothetical protein
MGSLDIIQGPATHTVPTGHSSSDRDWQSRGSRHCKAWNSSRCNTVTRSGIALSNQLRAACISEPCLPAS